MVFAFRALDAKLVLEEIIRFGLFYTIPIISRIPFGSAPSLPAEAPIRGAERSVGGV